MQSAMNEAATRALTHMLFAPYPAGSVDARHGQFVMLNVSRENLVSDTLAQLSLYESSDLKKPLRVSIKHKFKFKQSAKGRRNIILKLKLI